MLIDLAKDRKSQDNISVIVANVTTVCETDANEDTRLPGMTKYLIL